MTPEILEVAKSIESYLVIPEESDFLIKAAEQAKHGIIEVGSWTGRSSVLLAAVAREKGIPFVAVDTWESCDLNVGHDYFPVWKRNMVKAGLLWPEFSLSPDDLHNPSWGMGAFKDSGDHLAEFRVLRMASVPAARMFELLRPLVSKFDFIFIDADHEYQSVKNDFFSWIPNLIRPATVVLHDVDCAHVGVKKFFGELKDHGLVAESAGNIGLVRLT